MELSDLRLFRTILEEGNMTRAAEKLGYVQSNMTMRIRKLEEELGVQLFDRTPKGVEPTGEGLLLNEYAVEILHLAEEAKKAVGERSRPSGPLAIGVVETVSANPLFIKALSAFQSEYPDVAMSLITGTSPQNYEKIASRELDGAFITGTFESDALQIESETVDEVILLAPAGKPPDAVQLASAWIVFPAGCPFRSILEEWAAVNGKPVNIIEVSTLEIMLNCVRAGIGYALLSRSAVPHNDFQLDVFPVPDEYRYVTTRLVTRKERFKRKTFAAFAACVAFHMNGD